MFLYVGDTAEQRDPYGSSLCSLCPGICYISLQFFPLLTVQTPYFFSAYVSTSELGAQNSQRDSCSAPLSHHTGRSSEPLSTPSCATLDIRTNSRSLSPIALHITNNCRPAPTPESPWRVTQLLHLSTLLTPRIAFSPPSHQKPKSVGIGDGRN